MQVGLFDHISNGARPLAQLFDERLDFVKACDEAGFYCLHLAEHHATPLNMVPVPGVFLGAAARVTKRIRLGPLVYLLPLYSPLRLAEEIAMLDHLSHGRLEVGVGRGVSPFELRYHKIDHAQSRDLFNDGFNCLTAALTTEALTYSGPHYQYDNVPIALRPLQQPHPPFWYGSSSAEGSTWAGEQGLHFVTLGSMKLAKDCIDAYKAAFAKRGKAAQPKPEFKGGAAIGVQRHIFVDETDEKAKAWARPAMNYHLDLINWLRTKHGVNNAQTARLVAFRGANFEEAVAEGSAIAGSPKTVLAELERHIDTLGVNYLLAYLFLGNMTAETANRSLRLFAAEVMPKLARL